MKQDDYAIDNHCNSYSTFEVPLIPKDVSQELFVGTSWNSIYAVSALITYSYGFICDLYHSSIPVVAAHQTP